MKSYIVSRASGETAANAVALALAEPLALTASLSANAGVIIEKPVKEKFTVYCKASEKASITVFATNFRIVNGELILPSGLVCKSWKVEKK